MYRTQVRATFSAAHYIPGHEGECANLHGHTWAVVVTWVFSEIDNLGMTTDFSELKRRLREALPDHRLLNDVYEFAPTAENIARHLCEELSAQAVAVWESEACCVEYVAG